MDGARAGADVDYQEEDRPLLAFHGGSEQAGDEESPSGNVTVHQAKDHPDHTCPEHQPCSSTREPSPYLGGVSRMQFRLIFGVILAQYFVAFFDQALLSTTHPVISSEFHSLNSASWLETAFLLTATTFQPLVARISDIIGRRPLHLFSLTVFAMTTAWCAMAGNMGSLVTARALCGFGAGGVLAMSPIMTNDLVPIDIRGSYQGYINLTVGLALASGSAFGGWICDHLGWRWAFGIQVPCIILILIAAYATTPSSLGPQLAKNSDRTTTQLVRGLDLAGALFLALTVGSLIFGLNFGGNILPWSHPMILTSFVISLVACLVLISVERRALLPVMPLKMLSTRPRANLVFSNFFAYMGDHTVLFNAPLFFQAVKLEPSSTTGFRMSAPNIAVTVFGLWSGLLMTWTGKTKWLLLTGSMSMILGAALLSGMWLRIPSWAATIFLIPEAAGMGLNTPATTISVLATSTYEDQAVMTTTLILWRRLGAVIGVAISSFLLQNALIVNLEQFVTGKHKTEIIENVRKSVKAVHDLSPQHRFEVTRAYQASLRTAFGFSFIVFILCFLLVLPVRVPSLRSLAKRS